MQLTSKAEIASQHMMLIFKSFFQEIKLQGSQMELSRVKLGKENDLPTVAHSRFEFHSSKFLQCKSHIFPVQISHFSSANLTFLQCKSHFSPVQNPAFPIPRVYLMRTLMNFILSKWLQLVLAKIEFLQ